MDVDLAHVVDNDRDAQSLAVAEDMVEERGFAGSEESGEDGDGKWCVWGHVDNDNALSYRVGGDGLGWRARKRA
jgi:hypothetical protein